MKLVAALVLLVAAISALPQEFDARNHPISDHVIGRITDLVERIRKRGLDPLHINKETASFALVVSRIFSAKGLVEDVYFEGLSNIIIHNVDYEPVSSVVTFDLWMPKIYGSVALASGAVVVFDNKIEGEGSGSLTITDIRVRGFVSVTVGVQGVTANSANIQASIGDIESAISLYFETANRQIDVSERLNNLINKTIPARLKQYKKQVEELIAIYVVRYINRP